jgi:hypothetical protein
VRLVDEEGTFDIVDAQGNSLTDGNGVNPDDHGDFHTWINAADNSEIFMKGTDKAGNTEITSLGIAKAPKLSGYTDPTAGQETEDVTVVNLIPGETVTLFYDKLPELNSRNMRMQRAAGEGVSAVADASGVARFTGLDISGLATGEHSHILVAQDSGEINFAFQVLAPQQNNNNSDTNSGLPKTGVDAAPENHGSLIALILTLGATLGGAGALLLKRLTNRA